MDRTKTMIVLIPVGEGDQTICGHIEDMQFENRDALANHLKEEEGVCNFSLLSLSEFMDDFNNQEMNPDDWFMTYIQIKN